MQHPILAAQIDWDASAATHSGAHELKLSGGDIHAKAITNVLGEGAENLDASL